MKKRVPDADQIQLQGERGDGYENESEARTKFHRHSLAVLIDSLANPAAFSLACVGAYAAATTFTVNVTGDSQDTNPGDGIVDGDDASPRSAAGDPNQSN